MTKPIRLLWSALALSLGIIMATTWISGQSARIHAALMQQLEDSGLVHEQAMEFQPGWLSAQSHGQMALADTLCAGCGALEYAGQLHHGLGAWLQGDPAWVSLAYQLRLPELPVSPALPSLSVAARQAFAGLNAELGLPPSHHRIQSLSPAYELNQAGIRGRVSARHLEISTPGLQLQRDGQDWLALQHLQLRAESRQRLQVQAQAAGLHLPRWRWLGQDLDIRYQQQGQGRKLDFDLDLTLPHSEIDGQSRQHDAHGQLAVNSLHLPATRAFIRELPRLLAAETSPTARMFGLLSLYSLHGPAFFAAAPQLKLSGSQFPLPDGALDMDIRLQISPGIRRPPMHPREWQRTLAGHVDIRAPAKQLQDWWSSVGSGLNLVTGLPRQYAELRRQGWVRSQPDGRERLYFSLHPHHGLRQDQQAATSRVGAS